MNSFAEKFKYYKDEIKKKKIEFIDIKVVNFFGLLKHFTYPVRVFNETLFTAGKGADGSSVGGYASVEFSDIRIIPDIDTGFIDPFFPEKTLSFLAFVSYPQKDEIMPLCPRGTAKRAEEVLRKLKIADNSYWIPELEYFLFDGYSISLDPMKTVVEFIADEGNTKENFDYKLNQKWGYGSVPPYDKGVVFRTELNKMVEDIGISIKVNHHEAGVPGQHEFELDFQPLLKSADNIILMKYFIKNLAYRYEKVATFMPKPMFGLAGSGMHLHQLLKKAGKNIFTGKGQNMISNLAKHYIGGILKHAKALTALTNPSTNSFKRLVPGYEAPTSICYSSSNRTSAIRIPGYIKNPEKMRFEYRPPDATANPYFALSALICAGIDGVKNKIDPGEPAIGNVENMKKYRKIPQNLLQALKSLKKDKNFLTINNVFTDKVLEHWINSKEKEAFEVGTYPNPKEVEVYFNF
ncbi:type I glutamate--ammonia ligase [bacterium]|nr:type I glutamate--ammonia ligase [bacterium]